MEIDENLEINSQNLETDRQLQNNRLQTEQTDLNGNYSSFSSQEFQKWLNLCTTHLITFFLLILWQRSYVPLAICVIPSALADFLIVIKCSFIIRKRRESYEKKLIFKDIIENLGTLTTKIFILVYLLKRNFKISFTLIPLFLSTLVNLMIKSISFNKCQIFSEIVFILMRIVRILTGVSVFCRIDGLYDFEWSLTFWPIWSFLSIVGIIVIGLALFYFGLSSSNSSRHRMQKLGGLYLIVSITVSMICFTFFFVTLSNGSPNFYPPFLFLLIFVPITYLLKYYLQVGVTQFLIDNPENEITQVFPITPTNRLKNTFISSFHSPPKFLIKLSNSYFKEVPNSHRPAKKRTSSVAVIPCDTIFHRRSITNGQFSQNFKFNPDSNEKIIEAEKCLTCMDKYSNALILNCGHGGTCYDCAYKLSLELGRCHICRGKIDKVARILQYPGGIHEVITETCQSS